MASDLPADNRPVTHTTAGIHLTIALVATGGLIKAVGTGLDLTGFLLVSLLMAFTMAAWSGVLRWAAEQFGRR